MEEPFLPSRHGSKHVARTRTLHGITFAERNDVTLAEPRNPQKAENAAGWVELVRGTTQWRVSSGGRYRDYEVCWFDTLAEARKCFRSIVKDLNTYYVVQTKPPEEGWGDFSHRKFPTKGKAESLVLDYFIQNFQEKGIKHRIVERQYTSSDTIAEEPEEVDED